ncbi:MAG: molybdopterin-binding protein [Oscillospiraceae bacterium]
MKQIDTKDAVAHVLCHDITRIVKGQVKEAAFRKGHIVTEEDIPALLKLGKDHLYVWEKQPGMMHENEAAEVLYNICAGPYMQPTPVKEGKIEVVAQVDGLLTVDVERLHAINMLGQMMIATRSGNFRVNKGDKLAGTRIIPLLIEESKMQTAQQAAGKEPLLTLHPFHKKKVGIIATGNEVFYGRIQDTFTPTLVSKLKEFDAEVLFCKTLPDDPDGVTAEILDMVKQGADIVLCTGGMSVDPDDRTPLAIKNTGARIVSYGAPVLPGAMFLLSYLPGGATVMGLPGCVMYEKRTIFDLILPKVMADVEVTEENLAALGHGGLCLNCSPCTFPVCSFGKGV